MTVTAVVNVHFGENLKEEEKRPKKGGENYFFYLNLFDIFIYIYVIKNFNGWAIGEFHLYRRLVVLSKNKDLVDFGGLGYL